ncbi:MAG: metallophosphoesterase [Spirochaetaceae bacterium]|jgi:3',5'-cyclic AMP phosphodiesterase CpdA|nr:metallophosphoesterase [Spirochaetaceae bacterium]
MVVRRNGNLKAILFFALLSCALVLSAASCSVDIFGLFSSNDFDERFEDRNTFRLLAKEDRALSLPAEEEYSFVVLTDTHIENGNDQGLGRLIGFIDRNGAGTDDKFVVITGDITQNGKREDLECFINFIKELKEKKSIPCYPVLGNHDIYFNNWRNWRDLIGSSCYRVGASGSGTTLFILDSANASFGFRQLDWLERELGKTSGHVFLFTHVNFFVKDLGFADMQHFTDVRERARVISLLAGKAEAVFSGHIHKRIERESGGVKYIAVEDFKDNRTWCRVYVTKTGVRYEFNKL